MENEFITYDLAVKLKALGFDEPCMGVYYGDVEDIQFTLNVRETQYYAQKGYKNGVLAPLYQQAFRWFIDKHGLHIHMCPEFYKDGINYCWQILWYLPKDKWTDSNVHGGTMFYGDNHEYPTKEEAENACIDKMIEIVKNK